MIIALLPTFMIYRSCTVGAPLAPAALRRRCAAADDMIGVDGYDGNQDQHRQPLEELQHVLSEPESTSLLVLRKQACLAYSSAAACVLPGWRIRKALTADCSGSSLRG